MSTMFSSKSSGGGVVVVRLAMTDIVPSDAPQLRQPRPCPAPVPVDKQVRGSGRGAGMAGEELGGGEAAVHEDHLAGHIVAGAAGEEHGRAREVLWFAVAADHRPRGQRRGPHRGPWALR